MHELSIAESICRSVRERVGDARIDEMVIELGALSGVNRESLEFCLGEAARLNDMALGRFEVRVAPVRATCACGHEYEPADLLDPCPRCGGYERAYTGGEDVVVSKLVVVENDGKED